MSTTEINKFEVSLSEAEVTLSPGSAVQMTISMTNFQETADRLSVEMKIHLHMDQVLA